MPVIIGPGIFSRAWRSRCPASPGWPRCRCSPPTICRFRGKNVRMVVGAAPGGFDRSRRQGWVARFPWSSTCPANPAIVVQNMPRAPAASARSIISCSRVAPRRAHLPRRARAAEVSPDVIRKETRLSNMTPTRLAFIGGHRQCRLGAGSRATTPSPASAAMDGPPVAMAQVSSTRIAAQVVFWGSRISRLEHQMDQRLSGQRRIPAGAERRARSTWSTRRAPRSCWPLLQEGYGAVAQMGGLPRWQAGAARGLFPDTPLFSELIGGKISGCRDAGL